MSRALLLAAAMAAAAFVPPSAAQSFPARNIRLIVIQKSLDTWGVEPYHLSVDQFTARYKADIEIFRKVVSDGNIKVE